MFNWSFTDYGSSYSAFDKGGIKGGFELTTEKIVNGALVVLYHKGLELTKNKVIDAGGSISKDIFSFPGGKRFEFIDLSGKQIGGLVKRLIFFYFS